MLASTDNQLRCRLLVEVDQPTAQEREVSSCKLRQIEGERNFALEPWLHRVSIGRYDVIRIGARKIGDMQIGYFPKDLVA